jgi:NADH:ubiquinone oxidoreductase subunit 4 (subunit M)
LFTYLKRFHVLVNTREWKGLVAGSFVKRVGRGFVILSIFERIEVEVAGSIVKKLRRGFAFLCTRE